MCLLFQKNKRHESAKQVLALLFPAVMVMVNWSLVMGMGRKRDARTDRKGSMVWVTHNFPMNLTMLN